MFCKLLILKDKLRVALEWIHSRHARAAKASRLGRYNARPTRKGCTRMQSRLTMQGKAATLRSIDTQKARHSTNPAQAAQDARESGGTARNPARVARMQAKETDKRKPHSTARKETDAARTRTHPSEPASRTKPSRATRLDKQHGMLHCEALNK